MPKAIQIEDVTKQFGGASALRGVTLDIEAGTVFGLLGPNGAGKTTLVRILATLERPDSGRATVCGYDVVRQAVLVRRMIGLAGQYPAVDSDISGRENLYLVGRLYNLSPRKARARADELLEIFRLSDSGRRVVKGYSGGMRRRLDLAASLLGRPPVLYLDEPTTGLDPHSRKDLWVHIKSLVAEGVTLLLTTQYMAEAEALADSVAVVDGGRVVASGRTDELRTRIGGCVLQVRPARADEVGTVRGALAAANLDRAITSEDPGLVLVQIGSDDALTAALRALADSGVTVTEVSAHTPSLDEVFLSLTGAGSATPAVTLNGVSGRGAA